MPKDKIFGTDSDSDNSSSDATESAVETQPQSWYAYCSSTQHPTSSVWNGPKHSSRREAVKDAVDHNRVFAHHAQVLGPVD